MEQINSDILPKNPPRKGASSSRHVTIAGEYCMRKPKKKTNKRSVNSVKPQQRKAKYDYHLNFNEVIFVLKKPSELRLTPELSGMIDYFKNNKFFKDFAEESGIEALEDCYRRLQYLKIEKGQYVMKQGDDGDTYYIILSGRISILINTTISKDWDLMELLKEIVENDEFLIHDSKLQVVLKELEYYFPKIIQEKDGEYSIADFEKARRYIKAGSNRSFQRTNEYGVKVSVKKPFEFNKRVKVAEMGDGYDFGELALLENRPRAASIWTLTECHFAYMDKETFKHIMNDMKNRK